MTVSRPNEFWERLRAVSEERGVECSPAAVAREVGVWPSAVTKWVAGTGLPTQKHLIELARRRGVNTEWLLTGQGEKYAKSEDALTREMFDSWVRLSESSRKRLLSAARYELSVQAAELTSVTEQIAKLL